MRSGPAIVLTGKGYKERYWLVVPPSTTSVTSTPIITTSHSVMPSSSHTIPGSQDQFGRGRAAVQVRGQAGLRTNTGRAITPFMFNEEGYRVSPSWGHHSTCTDRVFSTLATRRVGSILRLTTSTVVPTPTTRIRTGSKTYSVATLSMPSVAWLVAS